MVDDLTLALSCGYPDKLKFKAYQRLAVAYTSLGDNVRAGDTYKLLLESLELGDLSPEKKKKMKADCVQAVQKLKSTKVTAKKETTPPPYLSNLTLEN